MAAATSASCWPRTSIIGMCLPQFAQFQFDLNPDRQHLGPARPADRTDPLFHGPPGGRPFPRRGARPALLPNLRTLRPRAAPADADRAAVIRGLRPPHIEDVRLVDARPRSADSVLRR